MLEVLYDTGTREIRAWCGDPNQFGNFKPGTGQTVVVLPIKVADIPRGRDYTLSADGKNIVTQTPHVEPPDYKAQWRVATTATTKLVILGKILGLEDKG